MKLTNDNFFIDSNIALYLIDDIESEKKKISISLINRIGFISPQVVFETLNVCLRKRKLDKATSLTFVRYLVEASFLQQEDEKVIEMALYLFERYSLSSYDSKIIATALEAGCTILYSEDMQNGRIIDERLTIINPFL